MILQVGIQHLEVVFVRLRSDEAGHVVDHERVIATRQTVGQRLERGHVDAFVLAVGELAALPGLEIHELLRCAGQGAGLLHGSIGAIEEIDRNVELGEVGALGAGQTLKHDFDRRAGLQTGELGFDVREHADLCRRTGLAPHGVHVHQHVGNVVFAVDGRIDADERIAAGQGEPAINEQRQRAQIVGRMVGLQT